MDFYQTFFALFKRPLRAALAYNKWAAEYDKQPDNLMLALDTAVVGQLLTNISLAGKQIVDIGCGTGRHWPLLLTTRPASIRGYDISEGMLNILRKKFPIADAQLIRNEVETREPDGSCEVLISTLTVAHIEQLEKAFREWARILQAGGYLILTDYHPAALSRGATRSFNKGRKKITIKNHVHSLSRIQELAVQNGLEILQTEERRVDESVRHWYADQDALTIYEQFYNTPIIYGMLLRKNNGV
jgi:ubiquinone/menaquinone biosynthesis C-methylase UbiE